MLVEAKQTKAVTDYKEEKDVSSLIRDAAERGEYSEVTYISEGMKLELDKLGYTLAIFEPDVARTIISWEK